MAPLTGFRSAAPLSGCTSLSVGAGLDPLASVKGAELEKLVALDCQSATQQTTSLRYKPASIRIGGSAKDSCEAG